MLEVLAGSGLASAAGLNAYIPLVVLGALGRWTSFVELPESWQWLTNGWVLAILVLLLVVDVVADKVPVVDSVHDVIQTVVRPVSGGIAFGAGAGSQTVVTQDPGEFFTSGSWVPVAVGLVLALAVHLTKSATRVAVTTTTAGTANPVVSTVEDASSIGLSLAAILAPVLVLVGVVGLAWAAFRVRSRRRARRDRAREGGRERRSGGQGLRVPPAAP